MENGLLPVLALVVWTCVMWFLLYLTRIPAMKKARIHPNSARHPGSYHEKLPANVRSIADNYNHLHEQPTIFYAIMFYAALTEGLSALVVGCAWFYVAGRVIHSLIQFLSPNVMLRFTAFFITSLALIAITVLQIVAYFGAL